jgi:hypothetical protein
MDSGLCLGLMLIASAGSICRNLQGTHGRNGLAALSKQPRLEDGSHSCEDPALWKNLHLQFLQMEMFPKGSASLEYEIEHSLWEVKTEVFRVPG